MGINKPNVRYVIHYDLPKNIEGYYQETGRAGRDGLPSDCLLLFSAADVVKQTKFLDEISEEEQRNIARAQLQQMIHYAESAECRRTKLLGYFGEKFTEQNCGGCDNCLTPRELFDGTVAAQKFLSTVWRAREASFRKDATFGILHHVEVLSGANTERIRKWRHNQLSTYGVGKEFTRPQWQAIARELVRMGLLRQSTGEYAVIEITDEGLRFLRERRTISLPQPMIAISKPEKRVGEITCDEALFEVLRVLRREIAESLAVPAYIVFGDNTLRHIARSYPTNEREFSNIPGVGAQKLEKFGARFIDCIVNFLRDHPRQSFKETLELAKPRSNSSSGGVPNSAHLTWQMFEAGDPIDAIAKDRDISVGTVLDHISVCVENGRSLDLAILLTPEQISQIKGAFAIHGTDRLKPVFEELNGKIEYGRLRIARAILFPRKS